MDPSGLTQKDLEKIAEEAGVPSPRAKITKKKPSSLAPETGPVVPDSTQDEERILYWIWGKINPTYKQYVEKDRIATYLRHQPEICQSFGIFMPDLRRVLGTMITERFGALNFDEFDIFLSEGMKWTRDMRMAREGLPIEDILTDVNYILADLADGEDTKIELKKVIEDLENCVRNFENPRHAERLEKIVKALRDFEGGFSRKPVQVNKHRLYECFAGIPIITNLLQKYANSVEIKMDGMYRRSISSNPATRHKARGSDGFRNQQESGFKGVGIDFGLEGGREKEVTRSIVWPSVIDLCVRVFDEARATSGRREVDSMKLIKTFRADVDVANNISREVVVFSDGKKWTLADFLEHLEEELFSKVPEKTTTDLNTVLSFITGTLTKQNQDPQKQAEAPLSENRKFSKMSTIHVDEHDELKDKLMANYPYLDSVQSVPQIPILEPSSPYRSPLEDNHWKRLCNFNEDRLSRDGRRELERRKKQEEEDNKKAKEEMYRQLKEKYGHKLAQQSKGKKKLLSKKQADKVEKEKEKSRKMQNLLRMQQGIGGTHFEENLNDDDKELLRQARMLRKMGKI